jgi:hypothetical protein
MADPPQLPGGWLPPQPGRPSEPAQPGPPERPQPPVFVKPEGGGMDGLAVAALVCAIVSLGLLVFSLGLSFFFSLPLAVGGWVLAARSERPGAGKTLSIVAVALSVTAMIVWVVLIAAGVSVEELQRNLEEELERQRQRS